MDAKIDEFRRVAPQELERLISAIDDDFSGWHADARKAPR